MFCHLLSIYIFFNCNLMRSWFSFYFPLIMQPSLLLKFPVFDFTRIGSLVVLLLDIFHRDLFENSYRQSCSSTGKICCTNSAVVSSESWHFLHRYITNHQLGRPDGWEGSIICANFYASFFVFRRCFRVRGHEKWKNVVRTNLTPICWHICADS